MGLKNVKERGVKGDISRLWLYGAGLTLMVVLGLTLAANAQGRGGEGQPPVYNPKTEATVAGIVRGIEPAKLTGKPQPVYLKLQTQTETLTVFLGPNWFVAQQGMRLEILDRVEVTGSRVSFQGKPGLIAREVKRGEQVMRLRDEAGKGSWGKRGEP